MILALHTSVFAAIKYPSRKQMAISELLIPELDSEARMTRLVLERVPVDKPDFAPHAKSMPLGKLAALVAQLAEFGVSVLTTPEFDFATGKYTPLKMESAAALVKVFDDGAARVRKTLVSIPEDAWTQPWRLAWNDKELFKGTRFQAYREMFLNHLVHHRAQLGVYLRMNEVPHPATYGPSADDKQGF
jgi:hypothetical protein